MKQRGVGRDPGSYSIITGIIMIIDSPDCWRWVGVPSIRQWMVINISRDID